jgi:hypothetical protein
MKRKRFSVKPTISSPGLANAGVITFRLVQKRGLIKSTYDSPDVRLP